MKKNDILTAEIEDMSNLGYGIARPDGMVTFVAGSVDGDVAEIKIIKTAQSYCVGRMNRLILPSPHRITGGCSAFPRCGGCAFQNISYEHELELKRGFVEAAMKKNRIDIEVAPVQSDGNISGWRNKVEYPVYGGKVGCYAQHSHDIVECTACPIQHRSFDPIVEYLKENLRKLPDLRHIYLRTAAGTGEIMLCFVTKTSADIPKQIVSDINAKFPAIVSIARNINSDDTNVILGDRTEIIYGKPMICDTLCGLSFDISPESFYQVNHGMAERLYMRGAELLGMSSGEKLIDLFCGIGTIGLSIAAACPGIKLTGVEICEPAVRNAEANARLNGIDAEFICGDANAVNDIKADAIVVDPPRKGLGAELVNLLCDRGPDKLLYISCNPETLARDLAGLGKAYRWEKADPYDMFPRTGHVETVCSMTHK